MKNTKHIMFLICLMVALSACGLPGTIKILATDPGYFDDPERQISEDFGKEIYAKAVAGDAPSQFTVGSYIINFSSMTPSRCERNFISGNTFIEKAAKQNYQPAVRLLNSKQYIQAKSSNNRSCQLKLKY